MHPVQEAIIRNAPSTPTLLAAPPMDEDERIEARIGRPPTNADRVAYRQDVARQQKRARSRRPRRGSALGVLAPDALAAREWLAGQGIELEIMGTGRTGTGRKSDRAKQREAR